jgi:hypothetical protein
MVRIRKQPSLQGIGAVFVDGFAPNFEEFDSLPWTAMLRDGTLEYRDWYNSVRNDRYRCARKYSESTYLTAFRNAVRIITDKDRQACRLPTCAYIGRLTGRHRPHSIESGTEGLWETDILKKFLPELQREYRHDEELGRRHYLQHILVYADPTNAAGSQIERWCDRWTQLLHFQEKSMQDYVRPDRLYLAWSELLYDLTQSAPDRLNLRRVFEHAR